MSGNKYIIFLLISFFILTIEDVLGKGDNGYKKRTDVKEIEAFCKQIRPGIKTKEFYSYCTKYGWYGISDKWSVGVVCDTISKFRQKKMVKYYIESNVLINGEKSLELLVEFRQCGYDKILYQYSFRKKTSDKSIDKVLQECFGFKADEYSDKYKLECGESIFNKTKQDSAADSIINNIIYNKK